MDYATHGQCDECRATVLMGEERDHQRAVHSRKRNIDWSPLCPVCGNVAMGQIWDLASGQAIRVCYSCKPATEFLVAGNEVVPNF